MSEKEDRYDAIKWAFSFLRFGLGECKECPFRHEVCGRYCTSIIENEDRWYKAWREHDSHKD